VDKKLFILFLLAFLPALLRGQTSASQYQLTRIDITQGLSANQVNCILKDSRGFMWFGTMSGLNRYDGYNFKVFRQALSDSTTLSDNFISSLMEGPDGLLWLTTRNGQNIYHPDKGNFQRDIRPVLRQYGIPGDSVSQILKDKAGVYWFVLPKTGLFGYVPATHKTTKISFKATENSAVTSIAEDAAGNIWIVHTDGLLQKMDGLSHQIVYQVQLPEQDGSSKQQDYQMMADNDSDLWIFSNSDIQGIYYYNQRQASFTHYNQNTGTIRLNTNIVRGVVQDNQGLIWIGTDHGGLNIIDKQKQSIQYLLNNSENPKSLSQNSINALYRDNSGIIWIGTYKKGICYYHENIVKFPLYQHQVFTANSLPYDDVNRFAEDAKGNLWIGTNGGGVNMYDPGKKTFFKYLAPPASLHHTDGLADDYITAIFEDRDGNIWIGGRTGVSVLSDAKLPLFSESEGLWKAWNLAVSPSAKGGLWAATSEGVCYWDGKTNIQKFSQTNGLSGDWIKRVFESRNGDVFLINGSRDLEILRDGKVIARKTFPDTLPTALVEDSQGMIVSCGGHLFRVAADKTEPYDFGTNTEPKFDWITNLGITRDGSILVSCVNGMFRVKNGICQHVDTAEGLPSDAVNCLYEDSRGAIWAGTAGGLARINGTHVQSWTREDGLFDNFIRSIIDDDQDRLWIQSAQGIFSLRKSKLETTGELECIPYDGPEAIKATDTREVEYSVCKTADGRIWFPSPQGLILVDPARITTNASVPATHIESVHANGKSYNHESRIVAPPGRGELDIQFTAPTFIAAQKQQFRYKLEGYQSNWEDAGTRRSAFFTNLKPGKYRFLAQATGGDGAVGATDEFEIELLPFFYQTKWFYLLCAGTLAAALVGIYYWRVRALKTQHERLELQVRNRTAELRDKTVQLEKEIEEREQMEREVERVHRKLLESSRLAGMAEVATGVLHNVGNVLNSVNISTSLLTERVGKSSISGVTKLARLMKEHESDLGGFFSSDPKAKMLPKYLDGLAAQLATEQTTALGELATLAKHVDHIKQVVAMQQSYAKVAGVTTLENVAELVEDALRMHESALDRHQVSLVRDYQESLPKINVDRHKVMQILLNLIQNAKYACDETTQPNKQISVRITRAAERIHIAIIDNGVGIPAENLVRIFNHGFTTKKDGHGFGLHSGALAAKEMGGELRAASEGPGKGATFTLSLPINPASGK